ncbi:hypothetical protein [Hymenobacter agri]
MDTPRKRKAAKTLDNSKKNTKERAKMLLEAFLSYPSFTPYSARIHDLAARYNSTTVLMFQHARRHNWQQHLEAVAEAQKSQEEFARVLDEKAPIRQDIPLSQLQRQIKDLSFLLLSASRTVVQNALLMIDHYAAKIGACIAEAGGIKHLDETTSKQVAGWQAQLSFYAKSIEKYIAPQAVTALLASINFSQNIPMDIDGIETGHFTIARLQQQLLAMGMSNAHADPDRAVAGHFEGQLPEIDGWTNQIQTDNLTFFKSPQPPQEPQP